ncbi:DoxX family protein [uncultured Mucilaginibacter sp.]|uniref:DoxX family protein n=1 Tax=uncultured Mucilaginibacter sp. TaxID=797541 RepID=UPI0025D5D28D|nr:DoxX family protein [uncultured Mucilaginibacter sp.]
MKFISRIQLWGDQNHPKWLDLFRIILGIVLVWKGISFMLNLHAFTSLMTESGLPMALSLSIVAHLIILLHVFGGFFIALGSNTRMFCLLNLPILVVAVVFVNLSQHIFRPYAEFWLSVSVLIGLVVFLVEGNGKLSVENRAEKMA